MQFILIGLLIFLSNISLSVFNLIAKENTLCSPDLQDIFVVVSLSCDIPPFWVWHFLFRNKVNVKVYKNKNIKQS